MTWTGGLRGVALGIALAAAAGTIGGVAFAQEGDQAAATESPLNLPSDIQMLAKFDPHVRKATAIVNGFIITDTDVEQRLNLALAANNQHVSDEEKQQLRLQVLRNLIDETLEIQEAKANDITVSQSDVDSTFAKVANQFKQTPEQFAAFLESKGSSAASMKRQITGEMAWQRLLDRKISPFVNVGDDEVKKVIARLESQKGTKEYHVGEIYLASTPANDAQVHATADRIMDQLRKGGSFQAYARQYSEASTAAVGGDLGWVRAPQLPDAIAAVLQQMQPGQISSPIQVPGGYSIIALAYERSVLT
ncbi:MAG TPA: peptidylprolyl isomerase, partial [Sphingomonas sp.]|nr:peptidylprolyl isomerase [Sphingomonas sp.]